MNILLMALLLLTASAANWEAYPCFLNGFISKIFTSEQLYNCSMCIDSVTLMLKIYGEVNKTLHSGIQVTEIVSMVSNSLFIVERGYLYCSSIMNGVNDLYDHMLLNFENMKNLQFSDIFLNMLYSSAGIVRNLRLSKKISHSNNTNCYNYTTLGSAWGDTVYNVIFNTFNISN